MSLPERIMKAAVAPTRLFLFGVVALTMLSGCTVQPLYGERPALAGAPAGAADRLASIAVKPVNTRQAQEVRNHLIFMFGGGAGQPATPRYSLDLGVTSVTQAAAIQQVALEDEPTAGVVTMTSTYRLTDSATGAVVASGRRVASAAFDQPVQRYASMRAERDAENRAARELAEQLRLAIALQLEQASVQ